MSYSQQITSHVTTTGQIEVATAGPLQISAAAVPSRDALAAGPLRVLAADGQHTPLKHPSDMPYLPMPDRSRLPWWLHVPPLRRRCPSRRRGTAFWLPRSGARQKKIAGMDPSRAGKEAAGRLGAEARREDMCGESDGIRIANSLGEVWGSCWTLFFSILSLNKVLGVR